MGRFITPGTIILGLSPADSDKIITEVETKAVAAVPCLAKVTDPDVLTTIDSMLTRMVSEWVREAGKIASQTTGPWSVSFVKSAVLAGGFSPDDLWWLRKLSGCDQEEVALPRGSFPPPPNLAHLFEVRK